MSGREDAGIPGNGIISLPRPEQERLILELTEYADFLIHSRAWWIPGDTASGTRRH